MDKYQRLPDSYGPLDSEAFDVHKDSQNLIMSQLGIHTMNAIESLNGIKLFINNNNNLEEFPLLV